MDEIFFVDVDCLISLGNNFFVKQCFTWMLPPYSPDPTPADFWMWSTVERTIYRQKSTICAFVVPKTHNYVTIQIILYFIKVFFHLNLTSQKIVLSNELRKSTSIEKTFIQL